MVKIRLKRVGKVKQPSYRVVVADSRRARDGRIIEAIGHYNPRAEPSIVEIDGERAIHWLERGAQPSDQVRKLLQITGAWQTFTGEGAPSPAPARPAAVKATPAASVEESPEDETVEDTSGAEVSQTAVDADAEEGVEAGVTPEAGVSEEDGTEQ